MTPTHDVLVVGGGLAGLAAATALAEAGRRVSVLEARKTLGGRATSFRDPVTGDRVDNGQHALFGCYHETFAFLRRIGAGETVALQPALMVDVVTDAGQRTRLACPALPPPLHLLAGLLRWSALSWRDVIAASRMARPLAASKRLAGGRTLSTAREGDNLGAGVLSSAERRALPMVDETVQAWLVRNGQTEQLMRCLWEPLAVAALNEPIDRAAALSFAHVLGRLFGGKRQDAAMALPTTPLDEMYVPQSRAFLAVRDARVSCGVSARVEAADDTGVVVLCGGDLVRAKDVVVAVPWHALDQVIAVRSPGLDETIAAARTTPASPIVSVHVWFDRPVSLGAPCVGLTSGPFQWVFDTSRVSSSTGGAGLSETTRVTMVGSAAESLVAMTNEEITERAFGALGRVLGAHDGGHGGVHGAQYRAHHGAHHSDQHSANDGANDSAKRAANSRAHDHHGDAPSASGAAHGWRVRRALVIRERRATFSVARHAPARPSTCTDVPGLYLAGDWVDTGLPATIEGAVASGHMAARAILGA